MQLGSPLADRCIRSTCASVVSMALAHFSSVSAAVVGLPHSAYSWAALLYRSRWLEVSPLEVATPAACSSSFAACQPEPRRLRAHDMGQCACWVGLRVRGGSLLACAGLFIGYLGPVKGFGVLQQGKGKRGQAGRPRLQDNLP